MILQNTTAQERAFNLAGVLNGFTVALHETTDNLKKPDAHLAKNSAEWLSKAVTGNLSKPDFDTAAPGLSLPVRAREVLTIKKMVSAGTWQSLSTIKNGYASLTASVKKDLPLLRFTGYGNNAPAKSGAGIGVPEIITATPDAPSVFFCVVHSVHLFFCVTVIIRAAHRIMVGCVGASFEAPVSVVSGYANPIQSTTLEIGVSGGGYLNHTSEAATWLLPPPKNHPLSGAFTLASNHAISSLPLALNPKPDLCYPIAHACLLLVFAKGALMLKSYDVSVNPLTYTKHLTALAQLANSMLASEVPNDTDFLLALLFSIEITSRDLHSLLEGSELPGGKA